MSEEGAVVRERPRNHGVAPETEEAERHAENRAELTHDDFYVPNGAA